uniref:Uncharacterized protein n=1 Tax=Anguilla anguilla TaxID=7936 RepID=A0A0E9QR88_ANGAN
MGLGHTSQFLSTEVFVFKFIFFYFLTTTKCNKYTLHPDFQRTPI